MKRLLIFTVLILASCASQRVITTHTIDRDSTYHSTRYLDSLYKAVFERDSTYRRDSVYIYIKGDTVTQYVEKELYRWRTKTDTVYRDRVRTDTVYMDRVDSVRIEKPTYIEKPIKWYNQGFIWVGRLCCLAFILWLIFLYLKIKF